LLPKGSQVLDISVFLLVALLIKRSSHVRPLFALLPVCSGNGGIASQIGQPVEVLFKHWVE